MRKLLLWIVAASTLVTGSAFADIYGVSVIVQDSTGALIAPGSPIVNMSLVSTPSTSGVAPSKIKLYLRATGVNPAAIVTITSSSYTRIVDFHRAIQNAMHYGGPFDLIVRAKSPYSLSAYDVSLESTGATLAEYGWN